MGLREEIEAGYIDGNGLVAPHLTGPIKGSDNGCMFTAEYYTMLKRLGQLTDQDRIDFNQKISQCINPQGMLCRVPVGQDDGLEGPDDYYAVLNGCKQLENVTIPRKLLWATIRYLGFLNNVKPGQETRPSFLVRQLQIVAAMISASFPSYFNPFHWIIRLLAFPLFFISAIVIFISCIDAPASDSDSRRLSWHLIQTVKPISIVCKLASLPWYHRLYNTYGVSGMRGVAARYYEINHPFIKWWVD